MLNLKDISIKVLDYVGRALDTYITYIQIDPDDLEGFQVKYVLWGTALLVVLAFIMLSVLLSLVKMGIYVVGLSVSFVSLFFVVYIIKNLIDRENK